MTILWVTVQDPPAVDVDALVRGGACVLAVPDTNLALVHLARTFYADPSREMTVVGITGTNGKTTTSFLVRPTRLERPRRVRCSVVGGRSTTGVQRLR